MNNRRKTDIEALQLEIQRLTSENERLKNLALKDHLTGLYNRLAFHDQTRSLEGTTSLAFIDVDFFKKVNDDHEHRGGDEVLKALASVLRGGVREDDFVYRFGGEEIIILMPETDLNLAILLGERIRTQVQDRFRKPLESLNKTIPITVSVGISSMRKGGNVTDLLSRADTALYEAKSTGRNKVCFLEEKSDTPAKKTRKRQ